MKTRAHKEVEHILGREVEQAFDGTYQWHSDGKEECADCKQPAKYLIVEKQKTCRSKSCIDEDHDYFKAWYYCGVCEVG